MSATPEQSLWREVLLLAVTDALHGVPAGGSPDPVLATSAARHYLTHLGRDMVDVCNLAGLDPVAVRDAMVKRLADALPVDQVARRSARPRKSKKPTELRKAGRPDPVEPTTYTHNGRTQTVAAWATEAGIRPDTLRYRLRQGWSFDRALAEPALSRSERKRAKSASAPRGTLYALDGRSQPLSAWAKEAGLKIGTVRARLADGWSLKRALTEPAVRRGNPSSLRRRRPPGVGSDLPALEGTGGGTVQQATPEMNFSTETVT